MASALLLTLAALCLTGCLADRNVSDYIHWKGADITAWHYYFPCRALEEEQQTLQGAVEAVQSLPSGLATSLAKIVTFQAQELETAKMFTYGTNAEGCVNGISDYMSKAIDDEIQNYNDCAGDALNKLNRLNNTWAKLKATYDAIYDKAKMSIYACAKNYPNKDSYPRLRSCVDSMTNNYFVAANSTMRACFPSPTMAYLAEVVVECASDSARAVADKGTQFLKMLKECAALSDKVDINDYAEQLSAWRGYNDTLSQQISSSQEMNYYQVMAIEDTMKYYYALQKQAMEQYVIEPRSLSFYMATMYTYLSPYYNTVTQTRVDNEEDVSCIGAAQAELDVAANTGANQSLQCDLEIVNNTKWLINGINDIFMGINSRMSSIGNPALLKCISRGYVFAPDTVAAGWRLVHDGFANDYYDQQVVIQSKVATLYSYVSSFFSGSDLPCGHSCLKPLFLAGETALYNLQRCLYRSYGTTYSVTTPTALTTTAAAYSTLTPS